MSDSGTNEIGSDDGNLLNEYGEFQIGNFQRPEYSSFGPKLSKTQSERH